MSHEIQNFSKTPIIFSEGTISTLPRDVLLEIFYLLKPQDVAKCARVCSNWNKLFQDAKVWKTLVLNKFGSDVVAFFETYVKEGALSWKEVFQFPALASFFNEVMQEEWSRFQEIESENPDYPGFSWRTLPFTTYGDYRFSITNSKDVKVRKGEEEPFILQGEKGKFLSHLSADGDLFALRQDGAIMRWNIETKQPKEVKRINLTVDASTRFLVIKGFVIVTTPKIEIFSYHDPEKTIPVENKNLPHLHHVLKNQDKIYFVERNSIQILDLSTGKFSTLQCDIPDSNFINCIAISSDNATLFVADTCHSIDRQILVYHPNGKIKQKLPLDLGRNINKMVVKKGLIFCFYNEEEMITENRGRYFPSIAILDLNTGETLEKISDILDPQKQRVKPEALQAIFSFLKIHKEKVPVKTDSKCLLM